MGICLEASGLMTRGSLSTSRTPLPRTLFIYLSSFVYPFLSVDLCPLRILKTLGLLSTGEVGDLIIRVFLKTVLQLDLCSNPFVLLIFSSVLILFINFSGDESEAFFFSFFFFAVLKEC